jgi:hypothetical protein
VSLSAPGAPDVNRAIELARQRLGRTKSGAKRLLVAAVVLLAVSVLWLALETAAAARLQAHGKHTWARIDQVYFNKRGAGITVSYPASDVYVSIPLWLSTGSYKVGGRVRISYDRSDPSHAVIATGLPAPGGIQGLPFFVLIGGLLLVVIAVVGWRSSVRSDAIVLKPPTAMSIASTAIESSDDVDLTLLDNGVPVAHVGQVPSKDWSPRDPPRPVLVFGTPTPKSTVVAVDLEHETALLRRLRDPKPARSESDVND